jgi:hypothetical protein
VLWEGIRTTHKLIFQVPHGARPHGHDRSLALCVNDPARWASTPVLQSTPLPNEGLSLLGTRDIWPYNSAPNAELETPDENGKAPIPRHVKVSPENGKYHGGIFKKEDYDFGNKGKKLKDFHKHDTSVSAGLFICEVLILRLYTSTTYFELDPAGFNLSKYLWREMADMKVDEDFLSQGGTEMSGGFRSNLSVSTRKK